MSALALVFRRLVERRLFGDDVALASAIPGAATTLGISLVVFGIAMQERPVEDVLLLLVIATAIWSFLGVLLDQNATADRLDRAVLEPLPISASTLAAARSLAHGVSLFIATMNLALPPVVFASIEHSPSIGARAFLAALLAAFVGMSIGELLRAALERTLGRARLAEQEGPLRLAIGVALFAAMFLAPSPGEALAAHPWLARLPPFSVAGLVGANAAAALPWAGAALAAAALASFGATRLARAGGDGASSRARTRPRAEPSGWRRRLVRADEFAGFAFGWAQIGRDRAFRSRVHPLFAFPFAVIVLVALKPAEPMLALMALYGSGVYAVVAQSFMMFSESDAGPRLLASLPITDVAGFRIGAEKAFVLRVVLPVFALLWLGLLALAAFSRGPGIVASTEFAILAFSAATLLCLRGFDRLPALPFSAPDRGAYPGDAASVAFTALLVLTVLALAALAARAHPAALLVELLALWTMIRLVFDRKRKRWNRMIAGLGTTARRA